MVGIDGVVLGMISLSLQIAILRFGLRHLGTACTSPAAKIVESQCKDGECTDWNYYSAGDLGGRAGTATLIFGISCGGGRR